MNEYFESGYFLSKGLLLKSHVQNMRSSIQSLFRRQFTNPTHSFDEGLFEFFSRDIKGYVNANRTAANLPLLYSIAYHPEILALLRKLGLQEPILCQKPTLRMDCRRLAMAKEYYKLPAHQDYRAMQGSLNSVVVSIPLVDADDNLGALQVVPGSHLRGLLPTQSTVEGKSKLDAARSIEIANIKDEEFVTVNQEEGDILVISSFLVHRSGTNVTESPRYTLLVRYNDLSDPTFQQNSFPNPFKMTHDDTLNPSINFAAELKDVFQHSH